MASRLVLIAHAETTATRRSAFSRGEGLDARGRDAAGALRGRIARHDRALTSPVAAAHETAAALALAAATTDEALRDLDAGVWAGRSLGEIATDDQAGAAAFLVDPTFAGHGGESIAGLVDRLRAWLGLMQGGSGVMVGVTHALVVRAALIAVLGAPADAIWRLDVAPLDRLILSSDGRRWTIRGLGAL